MLIIRKGFGDESNNQRGLKCHKDLFSIIKSEANNLYQRWFVAFFYSYKDCNQLEKELKYTIVKIEEYLLKKNGEKEESDMESHVDQALKEWKKEINTLLDCIDKEYEETKSELQVYSYKYNITKQVVQSTVNEELIRNIREQYQKPFETKFNELKGTIKDLEERKKVYQMFIDKIDKVVEKDGQHSSNHS